MKILQISPQLPLPLNDGGRKSIYGIFRTLSELGHDVHLICFDRQSETNRKALSDYGRLTTISSSVENNYFKMVLNLFSSVPYNISKYDSNKLKKQVLEIVRTETPDIIHIDHLHMVWIVDAVRQINPHTPVILREHNLETLIMKRFADRQRNPLIKWYADIQSKKLMAYEAFWTSKVDLNIMISGEDEIQLKKLNPSVKSITIPAGFDNSLNGKGISAEKIKNSICHIGPMDWQPNKDSLNWLLTEILPSILSKKPDIHLYIFGKGTENIPIHQSLQKNVTVMGYTENLWDILTKMEILVVPLRIGGGIRIKIIEALGFGLPVVTTSVGCEGINAVDGKHLLIGNTVSEIAEQTIRLSESEDQRNKMAKESVDFVQTNFSWTEIGKRFVSAYENLTGKKP